jgi:hypothetical protein
VPIERGGQTTKARRRGREEQRRTYVEVHVHAAILVQDKVSDNIGTLDVEIVVHECRQEPRVELLDEFDGALVCP